MVLGKLPEPGRPTIWITVGQGSTALAGGAGGGCLDIFTLIYPFSPLSPSLWETARYRLKYCLKGPLNPKQLTILRNFASIQVLLLLNNTKELDPSYWFLGLFWQKKLCLITKEIPYLYTYDKQGRPWSDSTFVATDLALHCLPMFLWLSIYE